MSRLPVRRSLAFPCAVPALPRLPTRRSLAPMPCAPSLRCLALPPLARSLPPTPCVPSLRCLALAPLPVPLSRSNTMSSLAPVSCRSTALCAVTSLRRRAFPHSRFCHPPLDVSLARYDAVHYLASVSCPSTARSLWSCAFRWSIALMPSSYCPTTRP